MAELSRDAFNKMLEGVVVDLHEAPVQPVTEEEAVEIKAEHDVQRWVKECADYVSVRPEGQGYTMGLVLTVDERTGNVLFNTWNMSTNDILAYCERMKVWALNKRGQ